MSEKLHAEPAKLYSNLRESDSLHTPLKEINSFSNTIQKIKDFRTIINMKLKNIKRNLKHISL